MKLALHPATNNELNKWLQSLPQSGLLFGPRGVGLFTIANEIASKNGQHLLVAPEKITKTSQTLQISVDRIRELYEQTRTIAGKGRRIIIIDDAELMSIAAQNAFLKLLEEPNPSTSFLLTSHQPERLLPTVRSRLQTLYIKPIDTIATQAFLSKLTKTHSIDENQLLFIANGLPAELTRLVSDESTLRVAVSQMTFAKNILEASTYDRVALIAKEKPNRPDALLLIESLLRLIQLKPSSKTPSDVEKLLVAYDRINGGGNVQIQLVSALI